MLFLQFLQFFRQNVIFEYFIDLIKQLRLFQYSHGNRIDYSGQRDKDAVVDWINTKIGPQSIEVDCQTMKLRLRDKKLALSYFGDFEGDLFDTHIAAAKTANLNEKFAFFHTNDGQCG